MSLASRWASDADQLFAEKHAVPSSRDVPHRLDAQWDEEKHPRDEHGRFSESEGGGEPWQKSEKEFTGVGEGVGPYPARGDDAAWNRYYAQRQQWEQSMLGAVSEGKLTPEEAHLRGLNSAGFDWSPLPEGPLYHVTTAADAVEAGGLKSRYQLGQESGHGLGGGDDKSISFTTDRATAEAVSSAFREAHDVAAGNITPQELWQRALSGQEATKPFAEGMAGYWKNGWKTGDPLPLGLDGILRGVEISGGDFGEPPKAGSGWRPVESGGGWTGADGKKFYHYFERDSTPDEKQAHAFDLYKNYAFWREHAGGRMDPLFFGSDVKALAKMDPTRDVALMEYQAKPGTMGTKMEGLHEWRAFSGNAVQLVKRHHA